MTRLSFQVKLMGDEKHKVEIGKSPMAGGLAQQPK